MLGDYKMEHKITTTISTNNNLDYLKLAIKSIRQNAYYKDMPIIEVDISKPIYLTCFINNPFSI